MRALANTCIAFRALRAHKLRTALTSLGMVIGVAAVITMLAVGAGARERVVEQIRSMGTNLVLVWARSTTVGGARIGARTLPAVTEEDAWALEREIPSVDAAAPFSTSRVRLVRGNQNWTTVLNAVTPEFLAVQEWDVGAGRAITQDESDTAAKVIVLGWTVATQLFGEAEPVGQTVRVKNVPFRVVGILDRKGQSAWGQDQDDIAVIPLSTARRNVIGRNPSTARAVESITVKISDRDLVPAAMEEIRALLRQRHGIEADR
jgi:putative ABC transport system permease protein